MATETTTTKRWPAQAAKAHFSELLEASLSEGPQIVTRRGVETAVLVPVREWRRLQESARPTLKELLLAESPRAEIPVPQRRRWRRRTPTALE
ncbi:MAG: type II toxin-antitoxin system Phd/YefM family antitoxin [bacterium]|nr:type II toxin-antitoxin system Phd/YefM family antitoxin [bacterium]